MEINPASAVEVAEDSAVEDHRPMAEPTLEDQQRARETVSAWLAEGYGVGTVTEGAVANNIFDSYERLEADVNARPGELSIIYVAERDRTPEHSVQVTKAQWKTFRKYCRPRFYFESEDAYVVPIRGLSLVTPRPEWDLRRIGMTIVTETHFPDKLGFDPDRPMARFIDFAKAVERMSASAVMFPSRDPFSCTVDGVFESKRKRQECRSSTPIWADCNGTFLSSGDSGVVLAWISGDGELHRRCYPKSLLLSDTLIAKEMMDRGCGWLPNSRMNNYLASQLQAVVGTRDVGLADRIGWLTHGAKWVYCTGITVICAAGSELDVFPAAGMKTVFSKRGTLAEWQKHVLDLVIGNKIVLAVLCLGLGSALMPLTGVDNGIFHFKGAKGRGKTTFLQVCASLFANGAQPGQGRMMGGDQPFMRKHYATTNGIEALALQYSGAVLLLDELGEGDGRKLGQEVYMLSSGMGKAAMKADRTLQDQQQWLLHIISTGEVSMSEQIIELGGEMRGGQQDRAADLNLRRNAIFTELHGRPDERTIAGDLKRACGRYYGTAAEALIRYAVDNAERLARELHHEVEEYAIDLAPDGVDPGQMRVVKRMAAAAVVGKLAIDAGVLTCAPEDIDEAIEYLVALWHDGLKAPIQRVAAYCAENIGDAGTRLDGANNHAWYVLKSTKESGKRPVAAIPVIEFDEYFEDDAKTLLAQLDAADLLLREQDNRRKHRWGKPARYFYAFDLEAVKEAMDEDARKLLPKLKS